MTSDIDYIVQHARTDFAEVFSEDADIKAFNEHIVPKIVEAYSNDPQRMKSRFDEIMNYGFRVHPDHMVDYLRVASVAEGVEDILNSDQVLAIIGERPLSVGKVIYHFSNTEHPVGFEGHRGMRFTSKNNINDVEEDIDSSNQIYVHHCEVIKPDLIIDHTAVGIQQWEITKQELLDDIFDPTGRYDPYDSRWYEATLPGAIKVKKIEKL